MKQKFFHVPAMDSESAETELNRFCDQHHIHHLEKHFVADGANSFWAICVAWSAQSGACSHHH